MGNSYLFQNLIPELKCDLCRSKPHLRFSELQLPSKNLKRSLGKLLSTVKALFTVTPSPPVLKCAVGWAVSFFVVSAPAVAEIRCKPIKVVREKNSKTGCYGSSHLGWIRERNCLFQFFRFRLSLFCLRVKKRCTNLFTPAYFIMLLYCSRNGYNYSMSCRSRP